MAATEAELAALRRWREDNPRATVAFEAFGSTWQIPAQLPVDLVLWRAELAAQGRSFDDLEGTDEIERFLVSVVGSDVLASWRSMEVDTMEVGVAAGRALAEKMLRGVDATGEASAGPASPSTTSSPTGTSSTPTSSASTDSTSPTPSPVA